MADIYKRAIEKWGVRLQVDQLIEECAEVIEAVSHYRRGKCSIDEVREELADLQIMLRQMRLIYGADRFDKIMAEKVNGLEAKLKLP